MINCSCHLLLYFVSFVYQLLLLFIIN